MFYIFLVLLLFLSVCLFFVCLLVCVCSFVCDCLFVCLSISSSMPVTFHSLLSLHLVLCFLPLLLSLFCIFLLLFRNFYASSCLLGQVTFLFYFTLPYVCVSLAVVQVIIYLLRHFIYLSFSKEPEGKAK